MDGLKKRSVIWRSRVGCPLTRTLSHGRRGLADKNNYTGWEQPLNNFCRRFGVARWQWLAVSHGIEVKAAILRLQNTDDRQQTELKTRYLLATDGHGWPRIKKFTEATDAEIMEGPECAEALFCRKGMLRVCGC